MSDMKNSGSYMGLSKCIGKLIPIRFVQRLDTRNTFAFHFQKVGIIFRELIMEMLPKQKPHTMSLGLIYLRSTFRFIQLII